MRNHLWTIYGRLKSRFSRNIPKINLWPANFEGFGANQINYIWYRTAISGHRKRNWFLLWLKYCSLSIPQVDISCVLIPYVIPGCLGYELMTYNTSHSDTYPTLWYDVYFQWVPVLKREGRQGDCPARHWRRWRQSSTSAVTTRAVTIMTFPFLWTL